MNIAFSTLGCKVNQYESQAMGELFEKAGYTIVQPYNDADVIIINSCTVTSEGSRKTRQLLRRFRSKNPDSIIVLTGCMPTAFPQESANLNEADIVLDNKHYDEIVERVESFIKNKIRLIDCSEHKKGEPFTPLEISRFNERQRAYIKIEDGCDRFCSYCIIPYARGRVRSKPLKSITHEAKTLAANGYKEVVLVGINLSAYGKDINLELCDAVGAACVDGIERIRLGSLEPDQISDRTFNALADCDRFCPHFHFSLQSGCDKTLLLMNRHYTTDDYSILAEKIYNIFDNPSLTTDIMVGFPGESEADFQESLSFVNKIGFARTHVFSYSARNGTPAANMKNQIPAQEKVRRSKIMIAAATENSRLFCLSQIGKKDLVLLEEKKGAFYEGYSKNYTRILVEADSSLQGKILPVNIVSSESDHCFATLIP